MAAEKTTYKASHLLLRDVPQELCKLYEVAHEMAAELATALLAMLQQPYTLRRSDGTEIEVSKGDIDRELQKLCNSLTPKTRSIFSDFANAVLPVKDGPGSDDRSFLRPENSYYLLYSEKTASGTRYQKRRAYRTLKTAVEDGLPWTTLKAELKETLEAEQKRKADPEYGLFSLDEWKAFHKSRDLETFGQTLLRRTPRKGLDAGLALRRQGALPLDRRGLDDRMICAVTAATTDRLRSWRECSHRCAIRKEELRQRFEEQLTRVNRQQYSVFRKYVEELKDRQYDITKKVIFGLTDALRSGNPGVFKTAYEVLNQPNYKAIHGDFRSLGFVYLAEERYRQAPDTAKVTLFDSAHSPLLLSFGMTGRGYPFRLDADRNSLLFVICASTGDIGLRCVPSRYFWQPSVEPVENGYTVEFTRLGGGSPRIKGVVKEPALMRVGERYYINMRVQVPVTPISQETWASKTFFKTSLLKKNARAPKKSLRVMGVDLGLNPAVAYAVAELGTRGKFPCPVSGMQPANFESSGTIGNVVSRRLHGQIKDLADQCYYGPKYIALSKKLRDGKSLSEIEESLLGRFIAGFGVVHIPDARGRKDNIGRRVGEIVREYRQLSREFSLRDNPDRRPKNWERVPAESFQMLRLLQNIRRMLRSWARYDWTKEKKGPPPQNELMSYNDYYRNLRLDTLKKLVHSVVRTAKENEVSLVVVENLQVVDYDDEVKGRKENTLRALWSPNMVLEHLERELANEGIDTFRVDPRHTSQISSLTEEFGYRSKLAKEKFYYRDNGGIYRINADINAAMNLVRRFLTRYRTFTGLRAWELADGSYLVPESDSQYFNAFLKLETGKTLAKLVPEKDQYVLVGISKPAHTKQKQQVPSSAKLRKFYRHEGQWLELAQHQAARAELEKQVLALGDKRIESVDVQ